MMRKSLAAAVAVAPVLAALAVGHARAETVISGASGPVKTSDKGDDVRVASGATVTPTATQAGVTRDDAHSVKNEGTISVTDVDGAVGILAIGGGTKGDITNSGGISITETYTATDSTSDGIVDGVWAKGTNRFGIEVIGPGVLDGSVTNTSTGTITVQGNNSFGISIGTGITGSLIDEAAIVMTADHSKGVVVTSTGAVGGAAKIAGAVTARGAGATGVEIDGTVTGILNISSGVSASGYRQVTRPTVADTLTKLTADELQQGGSAVTIAADVKGGIIVSAPPTGTSSTDTTTDKDGDGVVDSKQTTGSVISYGSAPALQIGAGSGGDGRNAPGERPPAEGKRPNIPGKLPTTPGPAKISPP